jgi:FMN phosphatase YigB (HAD superfamily)
MSSNKLISNKSPFYNLPNVVFDVDGVLFDFSKQFGDWWDRQDDIDLKKIQYNPKTYYFGYDEADYEKYSEIVNRFVDSGEHFPLLDDKIPELLQKLSKKYNIYIITAYKNITARKQQLDELNIPYVKLIMSYGRTKTSIIQELDLDPIAIFEDKPEEIKIMSDNDLVIYVPNQWNYTQCCEDYERVVMYDDIKDIIELLLI